MASTKREQAQRFYESGQLNEAIAAYRDAISEDPHDPELHCYLAVALKDAGRLDSAIDAYRTAISIDPDYAEAHCLLADALNQSGQLLDAIFEYREAVRIEPEFAEAYNELGNALRKDRQIEEAVEALQTASHLLPEDPLIHFNLGGALFGAGRFDEAVAEYEQTVRLKPDFAEAHSHLAGAYGSLGLWDESEASCRRAMDLSTNLADSHFHLGRVYRNKGKVEEAIAEFRRAVEIDPQLHSAWTVLAITLQYRGNLDEAIDAMRRALEIAPEHPELHLILGNLLTDRADFDQARGEYDQAISLRPDDPYIHANRLFTLHYDPRFTAAMIAEEHRRWNQDYALPLSDGYRPQYRNLPEPGRRLKIGYVSPNFGDHPAGRCLLPLLENHDRASVEVICYSDVETPDEITQRLQKSASAWREIRGQTDDQVFELIREDEIDILVDLAMHMRDNRMMVFARKPAPVQITWLAYPGTTGLTAMDYRLTDRFLDPPGTDLTCYSEKSIAIPDSWWCFDPITDLPPVSYLPATSNGYITFGCLNSPKKINAAVRALWARVLAAVPGSKMVILGPEGEFRQRTLEAMDRQGVARDRVDFTGRLSRPEYLTLHHCIDIALDSFPYNGHTTSFDALWMGVPVVSLTGQTVVSRGGLSLMSNIGLAGLVAATPEQFIRISADLAGDQLKLGLLRSTLRDRVRKSPLMDGPRFAKSFEAVYRQTWQTWCQSYMSATLNPPLT